MITTNEAVAAFQRLGDPNALKVDSTQQAFVTTTQSKYDNGSTVSYVNMTGLTTQEIGASETIIRANEDAKVVSTHINLLPLNTITSGNLNEVQQPNARMDKPFRTFTVNRNPSPFLTFPTLLDAVVEINVFNGTDFLGAFEIRYIKNIKSYQIKTRSFAVLALTSCADLLERLASPQLLDCTVNTLVEQLKELGFVDATPSIWSAA